MENTYYNHNQKVEFINTYKAPQSKNKFKSLFRDTLAMEYEKRKDLCEFSSEEIDELVTRMDFDGSNMVRAYLRSISYYNEFCIANGYLNGINAVKGKKVKTFYRDAVKEKGVIVENVHLHYEEQVQPVLQKTVDKNGKSKKVYTKTRASKDVRHTHYYEWKTASLEEKERWAIELLKVGLKRSTKPVVSCSFGIDSIVSLYLTRKALQEMGKTLSDVDVAWNDTANEFPQVRKYQKEITKDWGINLTISKPKRTLKHIIDANGGVTEDYFFTRKGDRSKNKQPLAEKCCGTLKHEPMKRLIKENTWDFVVVGLRADESWQRQMAAKRDGEFFFSSAEWKALICRPILWWTEEELWQYVEQEHIPYNELYEQNMIQEYPKNADKVIDDNCEQLTSIGIDCEALKNHDIEQVNKKQSLFLKKLKFKLFTPRTGCMMCPIPVKYGYMGYMRKNHEKVHNAMVYNLGYGKVLMEMKGVDMDGVPEGEENDYIKDILEQRPCTFDKFTK